MSAPYAICIIGNSHAAALKLAWTNRTPQLADGCSLTFFAAQKRLMTQLEREGRVLVTRNGEVAGRLAGTSGGKSYIEMDAYDAFVFVGLGFDVTAQQLCALGSTIGDLRFGPAPNLLSRACLEATAEAMLSRSILIKLLGMVSETVETPFLIAPAPFPFENLPAKGGLTGEERFRDSDFLIPLLQSGRRAAEKVAARHRAEILWQDETTIKFPGCSKWEFGLNPARFMQKENPNIVDGYHGNEEYGSIVLSHILRRLNELSGGRVLPDAAA